MLESFAYIESLNHLLNHTRPPCSKCTGALIKQGLLCLLKKKQRAPNSHHKREQHTKTTQGKTKIKDETTPNSNKQKQSQRKTKTTEEVGPHPTPATRTRSHKEENHKIVLKSPKTASDSKPSHEQARNSS